MFHIVVFAPNWLYFPHKSYHCIIDILFDWIEQNMVFVLHILDLCNRSSFIIIMIYVFKCIYSHENRRNWFRQQQKKRVSGALVSSDYMFAVVHFVRVPNFVVFLCVCVCEYYSLCVQPTNDRNICSACFKLNIQPRRTPSPPDPSLTPTLSRRLSDSFDMVAFVSLV